MAEPVDGDTARRVSRGPWRAGAADAAGNRPAAGPGLLPHESASEIEQDGWPPWLERVARCFAWPGGGGLAAIAKGRLQHGGFRAAAATALVLVLGTAAAIYVTGTSARTPPAGGPAPPGNQISVEARASLAAAVADCTALDGLRLTPGAHVVTARPVTGGSLPSPAGRHGTRVILSGLPGFCAVTVTQDGRPLAGQMQAWLPLPPSWNGRVKVVSDQASMPAAAAAALRDGYAAVGIANTGPAGRSSQLALEGMRASSAFYGVP